MPNLNKVILMGNMTRDPELRYTQNNAAVCAFGLAINRKWKSQDGKQNEETTFVDCTAWGRVAEVVNQYVFKGDPLFVEGRLTLDQWEDRDGGKRSKLKVTVENVQLLGSRKSGGGDRRQSAAPQSSRAPLTGADAHPEMDESDIPF